MRRWRKTMARALGRGSTKDFDGFTAQRQLVTNERPTIFDVGAASGGIALRYRRLFPNAVIHAFEPTDETFRDLTAKVGSDPDIHAHHIALGATAGEATLNLNRSRGTNSLLASDERAQRYWKRADLLDTQTQVTVTVETLDEFCADHAIDRIDILKIDVQGTEYEVLVGAERMLRSQAIDIVYLEIIHAPTYVGQRPLHEYLELFHDRGYKLFDFYNPVRWAGRLVQTENLMVSERMLATHEPERLSAT